MQILTETENSGRGTTAPPTAQSKIEPVSELRLQKFGNIAECLRRFPAELSADFIIRESRDRSRGAKSPQPREFRETRRGSCRDRTGWLGRQDSNRHIPFSKKAFEIPGELPPNLSHYGTRDFSRGSCWKWEGHPSSNTFATPPSSRDCGFWGVLWFVSVG
jgi:hypothetical protein